jgi:hypothetical protein
VVWLCVALMVISRLAILTMIECKLRTNPPYDHAANTLVLTDTQEQVGLRGLPLISCVKAKQLVQYADELFAAVFLMWGLDKSSHRRAAHDISRMD